jgi:ribosomal protein S18 acetylase RimI-like enzyme
MPRPQLDAAPMPGSGPAPGAPTVPPPAPVAPSPDDPDRRTPAATATSREAPVGTGEIVVHEARADDVREVERLSLAEFFDVYDRAFGRCPAATRLEVLVRLRATHPEPAAGTLVARTPDGALVGYCRYATVAMREASLLRQLGALRPLGPAGALRFAVIAGLAFSRDRPGRGEVFLRVGATALAWRRRGVQRRLLDEVERATALRGYRRWTVNVVADNRASLALFHRRGFRQVEVRTSRLKAWLLGETTVVRLEKRREPSGVPRSPDDEAVAATSVS